jgi:electron transfer flavoprotein alpha subunit
MLVMNFLRSITLLISTSALLIVGSFISLAQPPNGQTAALQKKAGEAQARIQANKHDRDQLMVALKTNEVASAKQVLLRNGFTADDLENAKIILQTGGGKKGQDEFVISATCCDPKEITIQRSLDYFTK